MLQASLKGFVDTEYDKRHTEIVGQKPRHVQEPALLPVTARKQIVHLVDHQHFEIHVPKMAECADLKFGHGMAPPTSAL